MKKNEKIREIRKRAEKYAESGDYQDWLMIEWKIRSEGLPEARQILDDKFIRDELDATCKRATSPKEIERRKRFASWLEECLDILNSQLKDTTKNVFFNVHGNTFFIRGGNLSFEIRRIFDSDEIYIDRLVEENDGKIYRNPSPDRGRFPDFNNIVGEKRVHLILSLVKEINDRS